MRRAIWMALAFMGTAPLVALAQQSAGGQATQQPAGSPSGAASIERGQDTAGVNTAGAPGQQSAGSVGTVTGEPTGGGAGMQGTGGTGGTGGAGVQQGAGAGGTGGTGMQGSSTGGTGAQSLDGVPLQRPGQGGQDLTGGTTGTGGAGGTVGPTYRGTSQESPQAVDTGTSTGTGAGGTGTSGGGATTGGTSGGGAGGGRTGAGGAAMGGASGGQPLMSSDAMVRELASLRERVARLERQVNAGGTGGAGSGTGGAGTTGGGTAGTRGTTGGTDTSNVRVEGPVTVATGVFDGRVVDVQPKHIDIVDTSDGAFYRLTIDKNTRAFVGPDLNRIPVERISEGTQVRTSFALISGEERALNIVTQPVRRQGAPQGQTPSR